MIRKLFYFLNGIMGITTLIKVALALQIRSVLKALILGPIFLAQIFYQVHLKNLFGNSLIIERTFSSIT